LFFFAIVFFVSSSFLARNNIYNVLPLPQSVKPNRQNALIKNHSMLRQLVTLGNTFMQKHPGPLEGWMTGLDYFLNRDLSLPLTMI